MKLFLCCYQFAGCVCSTGGIMVGGAELVRRAFFEYGGLCQVSKLVISWERREEGEVGD